MVKSEAGGWPRLSPETLDGLPPAIRRPAYRRQELAIGMAHLGVGAFHRCHQAVFTDDMLEARPGCWGCVGINIRPPRLAESLGPQDGLYTATLRQGSAAETRVIGSIRRVIDADSAAELDAAVAALAAPEIDVVTMTLTEKGYCHVPATGRLDDTNADMLADEAGGVLPRTALGLLARALDARRVRHGGGLTLISCDNIPGNGAILRSVLTDFARRRSVALADWIAERVTFPSTMVDRIVPATQPADIEHIRQQAGVTDLGAVVGEPFRQWVIEDAFAGRRPPWDAAGASFVAEVKPYELIKMRVLNAAQSTLSHLGALVGHEYSFEAGADPTLARITRDMLERETAWTLPILPGMEVAPYIETTFARIGNRAIRHRCHQIGTDGSQKIVQRILDPLRERRRAGLPADRLCLATASWIAYAASGAARYGRRWQPVDPWADRVIAMAEAAGDAHAFARAVLEIGAIFGDDMREEMVVAAIGRHLAGLLSADPAGYLRDLAAGRDAE
jgi:fructuronate reductase